jgi:FKBP-type peptidyl-prolyl cis-trans isomerase
MKNILFLFIGIMFIIAGTLTIGYFFLQDNKDQENKYVPSNLSESYSANTSKNTQTAPSGLKVQGVTEGKPQQQNQLPTPESFEVYEEFANSESIRYIDIVPSTGKEATPGDSVTMIYQGWLTNGQLFDQSRVNEQNQIEPYVFQLGGGQVIQGWEQGIVGMKEGGKRRLIIPSSLGYGSTGQGPIPANAMLIFDVELLKTEKSSNP